MRLIRIGTCLVNCDRISHVEPWYSPARPGPDGQEIPEGIGGCKIHLIGGGEPFLIEGAENWEKFDALAKDIAELSS